MQEISPDIKHLNDMAFDEKESYCSAKSFKLQPGSKKIKKDQSPDSGFRMINGEKTKDKGDYLVIHRFNQSTNRMNQVLQCKFCPLKFPKLCNLKDHMRIHKDELPFDCELCGKKFTQAGNRDRHQFN